jgi:transcription initiation factor IIE alpha subunit
MMAMCKRGHTLARMMPRFTLESQEPVDFVCPVCGAVLRNPVHPANMPKPA